MKHTCSSWVQATRRESNEEDILTRGMPAGHSPTAPWPPNLCLGLPPFGFSGLHTFSDVWADQSGLAQAFGSVVARLLTKLCCPRNRMGVGCLGREAMGGVVGSSCALSDREQRS